MNHCRAVSVPIMMIRGIRPFHMPMKPSFLATSKADAPLAWFNFETTTSAGCETMAQNTPAM